MYRKKRLQREQQKCKIEENCGKRDVVSEASPFSGQIC